MLFSPYEGRWLCWSGSAVLCLGIFWESTMPATLRVPQKVPLPGNGPKQILATWTLRELITEPKYDS